MGRTDHMSMFMLICIRKDDAKENSQIAGSDNNRLPGLAAQRGQQGRNQRGELVSARCEQRVGDEEAALADLTALLRKEVTATRAEVRHNLDETRAILSDLRARRKTDLAEESGMSVFRPGDCCRAVGLQTLRRIAPNIAGT
jgi:hypothetical protein